MSPQNEPSQVYDNKQVSTEQLKHKKNSKTMLSKITDAPDFEARVSGDSGGDKLAKENADLRERIKKLEAQGNTAPKEEKTVSPKDPPKAKKKQKSKYHADVETYDCYVEDDQIVFSGSVHEISGMKSVRVGVQIIEGSEQTAKLHPVKRMDADEIDSDGYFDTQIGASKFSSPIKYYACAMYRDKTWKGEVKEATFSEDEMSSSEVEESPSEEEPVVENEYITKEDLASVLSPIVSSIKELSKGIPKPEEKEVEQEEEVQDFGHPLYESEEDYSIEFIGEDFDNFKDTFQLFWMFPMGNDMYSILIGKRYSKENLDKITKLAEDESEMELMFSFKGNRGFPLFNAFFTSLPTHHSYSGYDGFIIVGSSVPSKTGSEIGDTMQARSQLL